MKNMALLDSQVAVVCASGGCFGVRPTGCRLQQHFLHEGDGASRALAVVLPDHGAFVLAMVRASGRGRNCDGGHGSSAILAARIIAHNGGTLILAMVSAAGG